MAAHGEFHGCVSGPAAHYAVRPLGARSPGWRLGLFSLAWGWSLAWAQPAASAPPSAAAPLAIENSSMDALLFYQLLFGELELGAGRAGYAFGVILDAARN